MAVFVLLFGFLLALPRTFYVNSQKFSMTYINNRVVLKSQGNVVYTGRVGSYYAYPFLCQGRLSYLELNYHNGWYSLFLNGNEYLRSREELYSPRGLCFEEKPVLVVGVKDRFLVLFDGRQYWIPPLFGPEFSPELTVKEGIPFLKFSESIRGRILERGSFIPPMEENLYFKGGEKPKTPKSPFWFNYSLAPNKYIAFGDSITYGCGYGTCEHDPPIGYPPRLEKLLRERIGPSQVVNCGVPGEETREGILRIDSLLQEQQARYILINEGTNDVVHVEYPLSVTEENLRGLIEHSLGFGTYVVLSTIIPRKDWFWYAPYFHNKLLNIVKLQRRLAKEYSLPLADFFKAFTDDPNWMDDLLSEGNHPSIKGYQLMAEKWEEAIETIAPYPPHDLSITKGKGKIYLSWKGGMESDLLGFLICNDGVCADLGLRFNWSISPWDLGEMELRSYDRAGNRSEPLRIEFREGE